MPYFRPTSGGTQRDYDTVELLRDAKKRATYYEMLEYFYNFLEICPEKHLEQYLLEVLQRNDYLEMLNAYDRLLETYELPHPYGPLNGNKRSSSLLGMSLIAVIMLGVWFLLGYLDRQSGQAFFSAAPYYSLPVEDVKITPKPEQLDMFGASFHGTIDNKHEIEMLLNIRNDKIFGFYLYTRHKKNIRLEGKINDKGEAIINGFEKDEGHIDIFNAQFNENRSRMYGTWTSAKDINNRKSFLVDLVK
jgi:hypothetical protein